ncbi:hypothetical protein [Asaia sp. HumB]|uniref:hypothetical protein n=1 Tax=Asaia sp. HumB TaxID=3035475 RepID=UPI002555F15B|nr:hypothetical protein [Asaia sp. HumB]MDL2169827.1 hypothetical protein [Asaia sp. HumB]
MSIIDRLVIQLGMDTKGFSGEARKSVEQLREVEKQAQATGSGMERDGVKAASFFSGVRREALAMFAVFTGGKSLKAFVTDTAQANAQLGYMARNLNMDPSQLYRLEAAAKAAGGSFGEVAQSFGSLQQRLTDPKQWGEITNAFSQLGVTDFLDKKGNINADLPALLNRGIRAQHDSTAKAIALMDQLGLGSGIKNQALMGEAEFSRFQTDQHKMSTPSSGDLKNLAALNQSILKLKEENDQLATSLAGQLSPELQRVIDQFTKWEQENPGPAKFIAGITAAVDELGKSFGGLGNILTGLASLAIARKLFGGDKKKLAELLEQVKKLKEEIAKGAPAEAAKKGIPTGKTQPMGSTYLEKGWLSRSLPEAPKAATPWGLVAVAASEIMKPQSTNDGEAKLLEQMRAEGRTGVHARGLASQSPLFDLFAQRVALRESGGDYNKIGGYNDAYSGKYQMGTSAIKDAANWLREPVPTREAFLADHEMQERFFRAFTDSNNAILSSSSDAYGKLGDLQRFAALGYAHNQGAGGAADWLKTGASRRDGFGTDAQEYAIDILKAGSDKLAQDAPPNGGAQTVLRYDAPKAEQETAIKRLAAGVDAHLRGQKPAVSLGREDIAMLLQRRDQPQSVSPQADAIKAWRDQQAQAVQSIGTGDVPRMAASVTAGSSPGSVSNTTTTNHNASFNGDVVIHTNATDAQGMARDAVPQLRKQLSSNNMAGLQ